jgi:ABC-type multidrug transport system fused ATPase/permease subunit
MIVAIIAVMLWMDVQLTLVTLLTVPLLFVATTWFRKGARRGYDMVRTRLARINAFLQEHFAGAQTVQIFNAEEKSRRKFHTINDDHRRANIDTIFYYAVFFPLVDFIGAVGIALVIWYGGYRVMQNTPENTVLSLGALVAEFLAANHSERVRSVVLIDPPFEQTEGSRQWLEVLLEAKRGTEEETYETVKELNIMSGNDEEWKRQTEWLRATADGPFEAMIQMIDDGRTAQLYEVLHRVTCPTLILQADPASGGVLSHTGVDLAMDYLNDATHIQFDQTGHSIHLERTEECVQVVSEFIDRSI